MVRLKHVALLIETSREYGRALLRGVTRYHREHGEWSVYFRPVGLSDPPPVWLKRWRGDGILARIDSRRMAASILATGLPAVDLRGSLAGLGIPEIGVDNQAVAVMVLQHLLDRGLRNFAFFSDRRGRNRWSDQRCDLFCKAVASAGYPCATLLSRQSNSNWESEQSQISEWLKRLPKPVGIMACNDDRGQQLLDACVRIGAHVPDDVAVVGVDNDACLCDLALPAMTSVDVNGERNGYEAARLLDRMMRGGRPPTRPVYLTPRRIVVRQSTDTLALNDTEVATVVRFIREHACRGISVEQALAQVPVSRSSITQRFKKLLNRTPMAELTRVRLERARQLLMDSDLAIAQVASKCGFREAKYLITVFHRTFGVTPHAFRMNGRPGHEKVEKNSKILD
jgi:LacI family transcriptional regulator